MVVFTMIYNVGSNCNRDRNGLKQKRNVLQQYFLHNVIKHRGKWVSETKYTTSIPYPQKMSNFPFMRRLKKILLHNAILVYVRSLPQASPDCQCPLALLANSMFRVFAILYLGGSVLYWLFPNLSTG